MSIHCYSFRCCAFCGLKYYNVSMKIDMDAYLNIVKVLLKIGSKVMISVGKNSVNKMINCVIFLLWFAIIPNSSKQNKKKNVNLKHKCLLLTLIPSMETSIELSKHKIYNC
jgi:hypothetical protein